MSSTVILCSNCGQQLIVPSEVRGKQVKCPKCKIVFAAPAGESEVRLLEQRKSDVPLRPQGWEDADSRGRDEGERRRRARYEDDEADREPGRRDRRWYGRYEDDDKEFERLRRQSRSDLELAESVVIGPAISLILLGSLFVLGGVYSFHLAQGRQQFQGIRLFYLAFAMFAFLWGSFIILGGAMMKTMRSYSLAMAASIMAFINHPCFVLHLVIGIWAVSVLNRPDIKRAFRWKAQR